ncbi:MAG: hypothetical protein ACN2B6_00250 [Rickettsiales bacterium]
MSKYSGITDTARDAVDTKSPVVEKQKVLSIMNAMSAVMALSSVLGHKDGATKQELARRIDSIGRIAKKNQSALALFALSDGILDIVCDEMKSIGYDQEEFLTAIGVVKNEK